MIRLPGEIHAFVISIPPWSDLRCNVFSEAEYTTISATLSRGALVFGEIVFYFHSTPTYQVLCLCVCEDVRAGVYVDDRTTRTELAEHWLPYFPCCNKQRQWLGISDIDFPLLTCWRNLWQKKYVLTTRTHTQAHTRTHTQTPTNKQTIWKTEYKRGMISTNTNVPLF